MFVRSISLFFELYLLILLHDDLVAFSYAIIFLIFMYVMQTICVCIYRSYLYFFLNNVCLTSTITCGCFIFTFINEFIFPQLRDLLLLFSSALKSSQTHAMTFYCFLHEHYPLNLFQASLCSFMS